MGLGTPDQGLNLGPLHWEHRVLATGPPGKSLDVLFLRQRGEQSCSWWPAVFATENLQNFVGRIRRHWYEYMDSRNIHRRTSGIYCWIGFVILNYSEKFTFKKCHTFIKFRVWVQDWTAYTVIYIESYLYRKAIFNRIYLWLIKQSLGKEFCILYLKFQWTDAF